MAAWHAGLDTEVGFVYPVDSLQADAAPEPTVLTTKDGDGTVNLRSLQVRPASACGQPLLTCCVL